MMTTRAFSLASSSSSATITGEIRIASAIALGRSSPCRNIDLTIRSSRKFRVNPDSATDCGIRGKLAGTVWLSILAVTFIGCSTLL